MELSWLMKLRIAAVAAVGVLLIGILAWPIAAPAEPFDAVSSRTITLVGSITLVILAVLIGFIAYFVSWPYGKEIGVLAVPAGLAIWALRSGTVADLIRLNPALEQRQALFAALKWEPLFWLAIVVAGFFGVFLGPIVRDKVAECTKKPHQRKAAKEKEKPRSVAKILLNGLLAMVCAALIAHICIAILARDVKVFDRELGAFVVAQPAVAQIAFAVSVSLGFAAFVVKKFFDAGYIWPTIASTLITAFAITTYVRASMLEYLVQRWPPVFFSQAVISILPVQMVAFGTLGSIAGYWLAVRYSYWRKNA